jgi:hypothetical protein
MNAGPEAEIGAYESYWHAHGVPAYAEQSARQSLVREHAERGHTEIRAAEAQRGDFEAGGRPATSQTGRQAGE